MKHALPSLDALKVFESAARQLSFSLAAVELCVTKGAVSYQIRKLERDLDCALFRRSIRQVYLTDAGQQLLQTTQRLFGELGVTLEQIRTDETRHDVLVGATTYVALRWLSSRISAFGELEPDIPILLQHSVNSDDFRIQDVDFAIRWCPMDGKQSRDRPLELPMPLFPVCSFKLLERFSDPTGQSGLSRDQFARAPLDSMPLLCEDRSLDLWQTWFGDDRPPLQNPRRIIGDANVRTQAAVDGQGWTMADSLMQRELDDGLLVAPFRHRLDGYGYAIQVPPNRYVSQNATRLRQWLVENG
jgi:DNA-binding transcriptional LysR family regulator